MSWYGINWIDTLFGIGITVLLIKGSWKILQQSFNILMDRELEPNLRQEILKTILSHTKVIEAHALRTRSTGQQDFIQVHITLEPALTLKEAHVIGDEVENILKVKYPKSEILIHLDPKDYKPNMPER
jgi:ferrous-iron efflux pump FieF